jgi:hypothetical protein
VTVDGVDATGVVVVSDTLVTALAPPHPPGVATIAFHPRDSSVRAAVLTNALTYEYGESIPTLGKAALMALFFTLAVAGALRLRR